MLDNTSSEDGFVGFLKRHKEWAGAITAVVSAIFGLPKIFDVAKDNITWSVLSGTGIIWLFLFWIYTKRVEHEVWGGVDQQPKREKVSLYPRGRKWALAGMITVPLLTISGFSIAKYIERHPTSKTIILIADFQGPEQQFAVTQTIINRMKRATIEFPEVQIKPLREVIQEGTERETISEIGSKHNASIIVWGFYAGTLNGTIHIDQVRQTNSVSLRRNEMDFNVTLTEGRGISVQEALSGDLNLLALLVIGVVRYDAKDYGSAIVRFTKALDQVYSSQSREEVADVKLFLGKSLYGKGNYREAVNTFQDVVSARKDDTDVLNWLGISLLEADRHAEALPILNLSLTLTEKKCGPDHPVIVSSLNNLAMLYYFQGKYEEAAPLFQRALVIQEKTGSDHPDSTYILNNLGLLYFAQGKYGDATPLFQRALAIREMANPDHPNTATSLNNVGALYFAQGKYDEATPLFQRALAIKEKTDPDHPGTAHSLNNLAELYREQGEYEDAERLHKRALAIREKTLGPEHQDTANSLNNLAVLYRKEGRYEEAENLCQRALSICEKILGKNHPTVATVLDNYTALLYEMNRIDEAARLEARSAKIRAKTNLKEQN